MIKLFAMFTVYVLNFSRAQFQKKKINTQIFNINHYKICNIKILLPFVLCVANSVFMLIPSKCIINTLKLCKIYNHYI